MADVLDPSAIPIDGATIQINGSGQLYVPGAAGISALTGDVVASGTGSVAATVEGIQGVPVAATTPTTGEVPTFNGTEYVPQTPSGGSLTWRGPAAH